MTFEEISRLKGAITYWVFRGQFNPKTGPIAVAWATIDVAIPSGLLRATMEFPKKIRNGFPETTGGAPERADVELTLLDFDGSLTNYFTGGLLPADEGLGPSFYNLTGKLCVGVKHPDLDESAEIEVTPTLVLAGSPSRRGYRISLPLASRDEIFAAPIPTIAVKDIVASTLIGDAYYCRTSPSESSYNNVAYLLSSSDFAVLKSEFTENLDTELVFPFGKFLAKPTLVTAKETGKPRWVLGCFKHEPSIYEISKISLRWGTVDHFTDQDFCVIKAKVSIPSLSGSQFWVVFIATDPAGTTGANVKTKAALDDGISLIAYSGDTCRVGFLDSTVSPEFPVKPWSPLDAGLEEYANPVALLYQLVRSFGKSPTFDLPAWRYAGKTMQSIFGVGGCLRSGQTLLDVIGGVTAPFALQLAILPSDQITISIFDDISQTTVSNLALFYEGGSIVSDFEEAIPVEAIADGAIASRLEIAWNSDTKDAWKGRTIPTLVPGFDRTPIVAEAKASIPGDFISPDSASVLLRGLIASKKFGNRMFRFCVEVPDAIRNLSKLARVTTSEGAKPGGYVNRLAKVIRYEIQPESGYAEVTCKDLGTLEDINWGQSLDTETNWINHLPSLGDKLQVNASVATLTSGSLKPEVVEGNSLLVLGVSYRITKILSSTKFEITPPFPTPVALTHDGSTKKCHRMPWVIMRNHVQEGITYKRGMIRLASTLTERFSNSDEGYRFRGL